MRQRYYCAVATTADQLYEVLEEFLVRLLNRSESESMDTLVDTPMSFTQARTLCALAQWPESVPIHEVAGALRLSMATAGRTLDHLVGQHLVERREDEHDRRVRRVALTRAGREFAERHLAAKREMLRAFVTSLPAADRDRLCAALRPILAGDCLRPAPLQQPSTQHTQRAQHAQHAQHT